MGRRTKGATILQARRNNLGVVNTKHGDMTFSAENVYVYVFGFLDP
jgi:hypothetical protein